MTCDGCMTPLNGEAWDCPYCDAPLCEFCSLCDSCGRLLVDQ